MSRKFSPGDSPAAESWAEEVFGDIGVLVSWHRAANRRASADRWRAHISVLARLSAPLSQESGSPMRWGALRIKELLYHLDTLDRRFSAVLQFQGLLATIFTFAYAASRSSTTATNRAVLPVIIGMIAVWFVNVYHCVRALSRMIWGNLAIDSTADRVAVGDRLADAAALSRAEDEQTELLIHFVMMRTARLRLTSLLTAIEMALGAVALTLNFVGR